MTDRPGMIREPSALNQAGVERSSFSSESLQLMELDKLSISRLRSIGDLQELPGTTGHCTGGDPGILCLRPREWLAVSETLSPDELTRFLSERAGAANAAVYDFTDGLAVFRLQGAGAPWLLGKLSGLDFLAGSRSGPHCAQTLMGHAGVLVHYHPSNDETCVFDLIVERSHARYFWDLLTESAAHADDLAGAYGAPAHDNKTNAARH